MTITDYTHPSYDQFAPLWRKVRDASAGEDAVKAAGKLYLPDPDETANDSSLRYQKYLARAVYFNATGRTLSGLLGVAYANWPALTMSRTIDPLRMDADGSGVDLIGQSQGVLADILKTGRAGLLADWTRGPEVKRARTLAEAEAAGTRPFVLSFSAEQILTWELIRGKLTRVVLKIFQDQYVDGEVRQLPTLLELLIVDDIYTIRTWVRHTSAGNFILTETVPTNISYIPFTFVGAVNNDSSPDTPPLLDLANLNLAHYRNSADFEESAFLMGQPTLAISGVTEDWREKQGGVVLGARSALVLPQDGRAELLQVAPNTLAETAMDRKEKMMAAMGARLLAPGEAVKTATQSAAETKAAYSQLSLACDNVSQAYTQVLQWLETWAFPQSKSTASFALDTRFNDLTIDSNAIRETVAAWQAGLVPQTDAWAVMRRLGVIDQGKTDEQLADEIEGQGPSLNLDAAA